MDTPETDDTESQLRAMSTHDVATAWYLAGCELERRGIDPDDLEFVQPEIH
jgi:hypothetical protein